MGLRAMRLTGRPRQAPSTAARRDQTGQRPDGGRNRHGVPRGSLWPRRCTMSRAAVGGTRTCACRARVGPPPRRSPSGRSNRCADGTGPLSLGGVAQVRGVRRRAAQSCWFTLSASPKITSRSNPYPGRLSRSCPLLAGVGLLVTLMGSALAAVVKTEKRVGSRKSADQARQCAR